MSHFPASGTLAKVLAGPVALVALCERIPLLKKRVFRLILGLR